jgi:hypothetical protein
MRDSMNILEAKVQMILLQEWDPIGVKDIPEASDEYDRYVSNLCRMLCMGESTANIYSHLRWIETERIGLDGDEQHTFLIAARLVDLLP